MISDFDPDYCGRFAPSPTGLLHAGSLTSALGSYLEARSRHGRWRLRMEDLDPQREVPGAADSILRVLERMGFEWDGTVEYQSRRHGLYQAALEHLIAQGLVYRCTCSRREIQLLARRGLDGMVYPGTCRQGRSELPRAFAWRLRVGQLPVQCVDALQGTIEQNLEQDIGDFVLLRADGYWAYQLAVVVDDAEQGITHVVRGADLLVSTPRQIYLQQCLHLPHPAYCHLPLLVNPAGEKLSKQTLAPAISADRALDELCDASRRLGHIPPLSLGSLSEFWSWAVDHWQLSRVPRGPVVLSAARSKIQ
jgi:glutamyl-Q tRNA(Asp) synthetase